MKTVKILLVASGLSGMLAGCGVTSQLHSELTYSEVATTETALDQFGIGVLTPSAPTGRESDKQALGGAFEGQLPMGNIMPLGAMLSAINTSGLAGRYARMLSDYEATGILERDTMRQIAEAAGVRYLANFNLGDFQQSRDKRLSIAGIRMFDTSRAIIRIHLEIWGGLTGEIAWQRNEELVYAREGVKEKPVSFSQVARMSADHLVLRVGESASRRVGESGSSVSDEIPEVLATRQVLGEQPVIHDPAVLVSAAANPEVRSQSSTDIGL